MHRTMIQTSLLAALAATTLVACQEYQQQVDAAAQQGDSQNLVRVTSPAQFDDYMKRGLSSASSTAPVMIDARLDVAVQAEAAAMDGASSAGISGTNLVVSGVDEGDLIKTDGRYLYAVQQPRYDYYPMPMPVVDPIVIEPALADESGVSREAIVPVDPPTAEAAAIRVLEIQADPADSRQIGRIEIPGGVGRFDSLYLAQGESADQADILVAVGDANDPWGWDVWRDPWYWRSGRTNIWGYDVSDPGQPSLRYSLDIDGFLLTSRRIGDTLYLVTRFTPTVPDYVIYPVSEADKAANAQRLAATPTDELLPSVAVNNEAPEPLLNPTDCYLPAASESTDIYSPSVITLTAIDLRKPAQRSSVCYVGGSDGFYVSNESFYLTYSDYSYETIDSAGIVAPPQERTIVHKFALAPKGPRYRASGSAAGVIGSSLPAFMMSERDGLFYLVTSSGFGNDIEHRLTILAETGTGLTEYATLPNRRHPQPIGKPGERLYAARFIGDKAYLVTYQTIDPLYVIDLARPADPQIAGELEMPGYSGYLHPVGDDRLLGIGQEATASGSLKGLKLALFDISDMSQPRQINALVIGDRGTNTPLLYDYHALAYLPGGEGGVDRFALPVSLYDYLPDSGYDWAQWIHTGLYLFEIDERGLRQQGVVVGAQADDWANASTAGDRAVIQGSAVHYVRDRAVISADWESVTPHQG